METASVVRTPATWLPEDDILLKTAIEEGASLEALAKGAVPFSRSFTLQEVHDRWFGLLYDPIISAQASEHLSFDVLNKCKEINATHRKRKVGTLQKRCNDYLKRCRTEFLSSMDLGFLKEPNHSCTANTGNGLLHGGKLSSTDANTMGFSSSLPSMPLDEDILFCSLNTEDPEIPSNDDVFLIIHPNSSIPSSAKTSLPSASRRYMNKNVIKVDSRTIGAPMLREFRQIEGHADTSVPRPKEIPFGSDQEVSENETEDLQFSDIESMILDMRLASYDDDLHFTRKVSKYLPEDSKRTVIRMEQCARASLQRSLTAQGAIGVLYGHHSKHFIRKTEVILGRSTEESVVDIDLGEEGRQNKISRRQAILKMETDGSFSLRNLSKNPVFVNGAEVGHGESTVLGSSCLIEIRGICFAFDTNQKYVDSFRKNIRNRGQPANLELVPKQEGV